MHVLSIAKGFHETEISHLSCSILFNTSIFMETSSLFISSSYRLLFISLSLFDTFFVLCKKKIWVFKLLFILIFISSSHLNHGLPTCLLPPDFPLKIFSIVYPPISHPEMHPSYPIILLLI